MSGAHDAADGCTGTLVATGVLFMATGVYQAVTTAGATQFTFDMVQRDGRGVMHVRAIWSGPEAEAFMRENRQLLRPGFALRMTFARIFVLHNELHGLVRDAQIAPARWPGRSAEPAAVAAGVAP